MLNSDFFSKRQFLLNMDGFRLWLKQQYGIVLQTSDFDAQVHYFSKYITFINYREKYVRTTAQTPIPNLTRHQNQKLYQLLFQQNISLIK